jgi:hypothetical protein
MGLDWLPERSRCHMQKVYWVLADLGEVLLLAASAAGLLLAASRLL